VLHPVGELPSAVYWRRRLIVAVLPLLLLGGAGWLGVALAGGDGGDDAAAASRPAPVPALERVVPTLTTVATPTPPSAAATGEAVAESPAAAVPEPRPGDPCTDDMLGLQVRVPATATVGSKPTFELLVSNDSTVPCVRALDKGLQELVLSDLAGNRVWGSNDCFPEASSDPRTLAPGETVVIPLVWSGLTSEPTCTAPRATPAPGGYVLRGRLDTKVSADAPLTLG
jgi:hypothetical protein